MGRFSGSKYRPVDDSSPEYAGKELANVILVIGAREDGTLGCPCGCTEFPAATTSTFKMGHDAKLRGKLLRAHLTGTAVVEVRGGAPVKPRPAMDIAKTHGWEKALTDAEMRREHSNRMVAHRAMNSKRLIKVGRWEYTGQVIAIRRNLKNELVWDVTYVTKMGDTRKTTIPADSAPEIS